MCRGRNGQAELADPRGEKDDTRFHSGYGLVGGSPELTRVIDRVESLAASHIPVLILGETGTGKELVARALHEAGRRGTGPFIPVNCAAFPEKDLLYTKLFGAARGAFTGCTREIVGALEAVARAARRIGMSRNGLSNKLRRLGIVRPRELKTR